MPAATVSKATVATTTPGQQALAASKVDSKQASKAINALVAHTAKLAKQKEEDQSAKNVLPLDGPQGDLKDRNNTVWLQVSVKQLNPKKSPKPVRIPVPNPVHVPGSVSVCLLVKDPQREYKDLLVEEKIKSVSRVVGVTKLKGKFKPFDARRELMKDHDLFLADERIVPLIPSLCGKIFFDARKAPITVNVTKRKALANEIDQAISSTYFLPNKGSCSSIKLGYLSSHSPEQLTENLAAVVPAIVSRIPGGWENVQSIEVKTGSSVSLPIWNCTLGSAADAEIVPAAEETPKKTPASKKRKAEADVVETPVKNKKVAELAKVETPAKKSETPAKKTETPLKRKAVEVEEPKSDKKPSPRKTRSAAAKGSETPLKKTAAASPVKKARSTPAKAKK